MHALTGWFIRNPVAANLLMAFILFVGVMTMLSIRIEGFPKIPPENILITSEYPGASASQVDELVTRKIETALEGLEGVRSISSQTENGFSVVSVRRAGGQDIQKLLDRVRLRIDRIRDFPSAVKHPVIDSSGYDFPALYISLYGQVDPKTLQVLTDRLKENLQAQPELSRLKVLGLFTREVRIEVEPELLRRYNLVVADVAERIRENSLSFRSGSLRTKGGNIILKADDKSLFYNDFVNLPIIERADGSSVLLGEIAHVTDAFEEGEYLFRFNGVPTTGIEVLVGHKENLLHISEVVNRVTESFGNQLPSGVDIAVWGDSAGYISDRLQLLRSNGIQGLLLVLLVLSLFLNVRLAFWVAMGIPVSVMGALAVAGTKWVDYSLNDVTTFGLIIVLGILVDDAVVVGESVFEERKVNRDPVLGTEAGVEKVAVATVFGVLTTIAAFYPMMLIDNPLGKVLAGFSGIVIFALVFSLLESKLILPAHLAQLHISDKEARFWFARLWNRVQALSRNCLDWVRDYLYAPLLKVVLGQRYAALILFVGAAVLGIGLIWTGQIKITFFPDVPGQIISVNLEMDARAPFRLTQSNVERIHEIGMEVNRDLQQRFDMNRAPIKASFIAIPDAGSAQIYAELIPVGERPEVGVLDIVNQWRQRCGQIEGATEFQITGAEEMGGGFHIRLFSKDRHQLKLASNDLKAFLEQIDGVGKTRDNLSGGQPQLSLKVRPEARSLGFTAEVLATQIGHIFGGTEVDKINRDGSEARVLVIGGRDARDSIADLAQVSLRSPDGDWYPLQAIAEVKGGYVADNVYRRNGKIVNTVSATIDRSLAAPEEVAQAAFEKLVPELRRQYPAVEIKAGGELEEMGEIKGGMKKALLIASVLIYVLMAVPLKSYWQPVLILAIVPFGFVGAALGHLIMDLPLSLFSFFGMLALTGVVINDSLVLITRYNQLRDEGRGVMEALNDAGIGRFRAIFLTTATTVIGLLPLLTETSEQAQYLIPAAVSLAFGELFSTVLMLLLVPVLIAVTEDGRVYIGRLLQLSGWRD